MSEAGVIVALALVIGCALLVGISSSSIAAISTNGIPRGGVFQILERSFGIGIGGSIALVYYLGIVILIAVEIVGCCTFTGIGDFFT